jgi:sortase B
MKKVLISIKNNQIIFSYKKNNSNISSDLINTNIISENELVFSDIYIKENSKILTSFIKELSIQYNIKEAVITKIDLAPLIINILSRATIIESLYIKEDDTITYEICESLVNIKHIKKLNCYSIQAFMIELLDKNNIICESRSEILYLSNFMEQNNLLQYSNIYYKTNIRITFPLSLEDLKDFEDFCKINKYLKVIHVNKLINKELERLIESLNKYNKTNIKVVIHENINDEKTINYLKEKNKKYKKNYKIYLTLEYSKDYLDKNLFRQTIANTLKICGLIISSLVVLVITYIGVSNIVEFKEVQAIKNDLNKIVENTDPKEIIDKKNEDNKQEILDNNENIDNEETPPELKLITNEALAALLVKNEEVVGEIKVNNTEVDYPVVQTKDNDYYLTHNINKEKNANGWIYMDYRNNSMNLDKNTILYGHNKLYSRVMFSSLHDTLNKKWYTNTENQIITFNTLYENMKFKIFSIYRIPKTNDYLKVFFKDDNDFLDFINMITKRSIYDFNVPINKDDKIITLSTCSGNYATNRLVIHAVLIEDNNNETEKPND